MTSNRHKAIGWTIGSPLLLVIALLPSDGTVSYVVSWIDMWMSGAGAVLAVVHWLEMEPKS